MMISLNINNEHYLNGIAELSKIAQMPSDELCVELICNFVDSFQLERKRWEQDYIYWHLPERVRKAMDGQGYRDIVNNREVL